MNKYEKAVEAMSRNGHTAYVVEEPVYDNGYNVETQFQVWLESWSANLETTHEFRLHENDIDEWAEIYDLYKIADVSDNNEQQNEQ